MQGTRGWEESQVRGGSGGYKTTSTEKELLFFLYLRKVTIDLNNKRNISKWFRRWASQHIIMIYVWKMNTHVNLISTHRICVPNYYNVPPHGIVQILYILITCIFSIKPIMMSRKSPKCWCGFFSLWTELPKSERPSNYPPWVAHPAHFCCST